jgi:sulfur-oxidizing protein SoxA
MTRWIAVLGSLFAMAAFAQDAPKEIDGRKSGYLFMSAETRALQEDDFLNPGFFAIDQGKALWAKAEGAQGKSCASCHQDAEKTMVGIAARYPEYDRKLGRVMDLETRINQERMDKMGTSGWDWESPELLAMTAYLSLQSRGMPVNVSVDGPAAPYFAAGRAFYQQKRGQLNLACSDCHEDRSGQYLRGDVISQGQVNAFPIYRLLWDALGSRQRMFVWCNRSVRAEPYAQGAPDYMALELYVAWRGRGLAIEAPGVRR